MDKQPPTLNEMRHALETELKVIDASATEVEAVIKHYGIKGMRWGIRRSDRELAKVRGDNGEEVASLKGTRKDAKHIKNMKPGEVLVTMDENQKPLIVVKKKDGTLKETTLSADAQSFMRTMNKESSEMSTREIKEANARAQAIEQYNKIFNPLAEPNAELKARVEAMELNSKYAQAQAKMNPSRTKRVVGFVNDLRPAFDAFQTADKALNGALNDNIDTLIKKMRGLDKDGNPLAEAASSAASSAAKAASGAAKVQPNPNFKKRKKSGSVPVYDITSFGRELN